MCVSLSYGIAEGTISSVTYAITRNSEGLGIEGISEEGGFGVIILHPYMRERRNAEKIILQKRNREAIILIGFIQGS